MPKTNKKNKRKRYSDEGTNDVELQDNDENSLSESSEEEVVKIHENRKQRATRLTKKTVKKIKNEPKCRAICFRYFLFVVVLSVGVAMVV